MDEEEGDPREAELDPPFPYRIRPVDWDWLRKPLPVSQEVSEELSEELSEE